MSDTFRHGPPAVRSGWIDRPRLTRLLDRRFDTDVLVMTAPAGYGKTSGLTLALGPEGSTGRGIDLWLQCEPRDQDADVLAAGILTSAGRPPSGSGFVGTAQKVADALLRFAPQPVCLVLDDVHVLAEGSSGLRLLDDVLERLPTNGHLLLSGRNLPPLRLARLRAQGRVEVLGVEDLAYDDDEVDQVLPGHDPADSAIARWPAMVTLLTAGTGVDTVDFLLEEVAAAFGNERLAALTALSHIRAVDDGLARAATDGQHDAETLLGRLPLVQRTPTGVFQMHDLWRDALTRHDLDAAAVAALDRVADHLLEVWHFIEATRQYAASGNVEGVERAAEAFVAQPLMFVSAADLRQMAALTAAASPDRPISAVMNATVALVGDERASAEAFEAAAVIAREAGDDRVEAIALKNATNMRGVLEPFAFPSWLTDRASALAEAGDPLGDSLLGLLESYAARAEGKPELAAEHLRRLNPTTSITDRVQHAFCMSDLGRPEEVAMPTAPELTTLAAAQAGGQYLAQAIWLRGEIAPEAALSLGRGLADASDAREVPHVQISTNAVLTFVAVAAGDQAEARTFADRASRWVGHTASEYVRTFAALADAATRFGDGDEEGARQGIERMLARVPVDPWPYRAYLYALPLIYALAPHTRERFDACRFGPSLTAVQQAARALVRLREADDPSASVDLPWHRPWLLRAHVAPRHLAELAAAAAASGHGQVGEVLAQLPSPRENLQYAADLGHGPTATWAQSRVAQLPARPGYDVAVTVLGPMTATRGATLITDDHWVRRERVRQILAYLLLHRRVARRRAAEDLWPDHPLDRALQNLRVNLSHLHRVLQPTRVPEDRPWFIRAEQEFLEVSPVGFDLDADRFDRGCETARRLDESAQGTRAIDGYRQAAALYRGDYLVDWPDADWAQAERVRLQALAVGSLSRLGELLLARGEPEEATSWATAVLRLEPVLERAHRLFVRGLAGQGNRPAAAKAMDTLRDRLEADGLEPERETLRLAAELGGRPEGRR